jgi:Fic family protein
MSALINPERLKKLLPSGVNSELLAAVRTANNAYFHWDQVKYRDTPAGLDAEDFWLAIKLNRMGGSQELPLTFDKKGSQLYYVSIPQHVEWLHMIDKQAGGTLLASGNNPALGDDSERYLYSSLMEEAIASSQLEGACTTRKVAKEMLRSQRKPETAGEQMILNNYQAILAIQELQKELLTPQLLLNLQSILMEGSEDKDIIGRFRRKDENIYVEDTLTKEPLHIPPHASELEWRLKEVCDFANNVSKPFIHPVIKAVILHFMMGYVHPFVDGNGRTARALFYWYLLKQNYGLFEYFPISRIIVRAPSRYARAYLYSETDEGDVTYFLQYNLRAILLSIGDFNKYVIHEEREAKEAARLLEDYPGLNQRQRFVIHDAIKNPGLNITFVSHEGKYHITNPTARTDLVGLVRLGLLEESKKGKTIFFRPVQNLRQVLHLPPRIKKTKDPMGRPPIAVTKKKADISPFVHPQQKRQGELFDMKEFEIEENEEVDDGEL